MALPFYAKTESNRGYIKNLEVLSHCEMDGNCGMFQMQLYRTADGRYYLYGCCFGGTQHGVMISEVTDPEHPRFVKHFPLLNPKEYPTTNSPKLQIADDLMIVAMTSGGGPDAFVSQDRSTIKSEAGVRIYSLKADPENPEFLSYWDCVLPMSWAYTVSCITAADMCICPVTVSALKA